MAEKRIFGMAHRDGEAFLEHFRPNWIIILFFGRIRLEALHASRFESLQVEPHRSIQLANTLLTPLAGCIVNFDLESLTLSSSNRSPSFFHSNGCCPSRYCHRQVIKHFKIERGLSSNAPTDPVRTSNEMATKSPSENKSFQRNGKWWQRTVKTRSLGDERGLREENMAGCCHANGARFGKICFNRKESS